MLSLPLIAPALVGAAIAGIASLAGAGISAGVSAHNTRVNNEAKKREAELAYQRERSAIKEQNAYNSPSAQMARMASAGLNPNLMYQQGESGQQMQTPVYHPGQYETPDTSALNGVSNAGVQAVQSMVSIKEMENQTITTEANLIVSQATAKNYNADTHLKDVTAQRCVELLGYEKDQMSVVIANGYSDLMSKQAERDRIAQLIKESEENVKLIQAKFHLTEEQTKNMSANTLRTLALLPDEKTLMQMNADQLAELAMKVSVERMFYDDYFDLERDKYELTRSYMRHSLELDKYKFDKSFGLQEFGAYSQTFLGTMNVMSSIVGPGKSLAQNFGRNPFTVSSSSYPF